MEPTKQHRDEQRAKIEHAKLHQAMKRASVTFSKRDRAAKLLDELLTIIPEHLLQPAIDWVLEKEAK
jgi:Tfp pilus assembly protein PilN